MAEKPTYYRNTMITPDGKVFMEECNEPNRAYFHKTFFRELKNIGDKTDDVRLLNDDFVHTKLCKDGLYILIVQEIK